MISSNGTITTVAGTGGHSGGMGCPVTGGPYLATQVNIARPNGLWIDELDSGFHLTQKKNGVYNGFLKKVSDY